MSQEKTWKTPSRGNFDFEGMKSEIKKYIESQPEKEYKITVGTDAQSFLKSQATRYVTAIITERVGKGAQYYVKQEYTAIAPSLRQKIWHEVLLTYNYINEMKQMIDSLKEEGFNVSLIPHVDVGEKGDTSALIREVTSIFKSEGYQVEIKPNSYAASSVADKHSK